MTDFTREAFERAVRPAVCTEMGNHGRNKPCPGPPQCQSIPAGNVVFVMMDFILANARIVPLEVTDGMVDAFVSRATKGLLTVYRINAAIDAGKLQ